MSSGGEVHPATPPKKEKEKQPEKPHSAKLESIGQLILLTLLLVLIYHASSVRPPLTIDKVSWSERQVAEGEVLSIEWSSSTPLSDHPVFLLLVKSVNDSMEWWLLKPGQLFVNTIFNSDGLSGTFQIQTFFPPDEYTVQIAEPTFIKKPRQLDNLVVVAGTKIDPTPDDLETLYPKEKLPITWTITGQKGATISMVLHDCSAVGTGENINFHLRDIHVNSDYETGNYNLIIPPVIPSGDYKIWFLRKPNYWPHPISAVPRIGKNCFSFRNGTRPMQIIPTWSPHQTISRGDPMTIWWLSHKTDVKDHILVKLTSQTKTHLHVNSEMLEFASHDFNTELRVDLVDAIYQFYQFNLEDQDGDGDIDANDTKSAVGWLDGGSFSWVANGKTAGPYKVEVFDARNRSDPVLVFTSTFIQKNDPKWKVTSPVGLTAVSRGAGMAIAWGQVDVSMWSSFLPSETNVSLRNLKVYRCNDTREGKHIGNVSDSNEFDWNVPHDFEHDMYLIRVVEGDKFPHTWEDSECFPILPSETELIVHILNDIFRFFVNLYHQMIENIVYFFTEYSYLAMTMSIVLASIIFCCYIKPNSFLPTTVLERQAVLNKEKKYIQKRRNPDDWKRSNSDDFVGIAFSGGGIRSAAYCLGALNAFSETNNIDKIDYISCVSGGGYTGSAYTAFCYNYLKNHPDANRKEALHKVVKDLTDRMFVNCGYLVNVGGNIFQRWFGVFVFWCVVVLSSLCNNLMVLSNLVILSHGVNIACGHKLLQVSKSPEPLFLLAHMRYDIIGGLAALFFGLSLLTGVIRSNSDKGRFITCLNSLFKLIAASLLFLAFLFPVTVMFLWTNLRVLVLIAGVSVFAIVNLLSTVGGGKSVQAFLPFLGSFLVVILLFITGGLTSIRITENSQFDKIDALTFSRPSQFDSSTGITIFDPPVLTMRHIDWITFISQVILIFVYRHWSQLLHNYYRKSLARNFYPSVDPKFRELTKNWKISAPYYLCNTTLNDVQIDKDETCIDFLFTPHVVGSHPTKYFTADDLRYPLSQGMSLSGAAATPSLGQMGQNLPGVKFLVNILGFNMGCWLEVYNGFWKRKVDFHWSSVFLFLIITFYAMSTELFFPLENTLDFSIAGILLFGVLLAFALFNEGTWILHSGYIRMLLQSFGFIWSLDTLPPYLFISDGGHMENTAILALLKRHCKVIYAFDAGAAADDDSRYNDLIKALEDFGPNLEECGVRVSVTGPAEVKDSHHFVQDLRHTLWEYKRNNVIRTITLDLFYSILDENGEWKSKTGKLYYCKLRKNQVDEEVEKLSDGLWAWKPPMSPAFPYTATTNQFFSPNIFNKYLLLGQAAALEVLGKKLVPRKTTPNEENKHSWTFMGFSHSAIFFLLLANVSLLVKTSIYDIPWILVALPLLPSLITYFVNDLGYSRKIFPSGWRHAVFVIFRIALHVWAALSWVIYLFSIDKVIPYTVFDDVHYRSTVSSSAFSLALCYGISLFTAQDLNSKSFRKWPIFVSFILTFSFIYNASHVFEYANLSAQYQEAHKKWGYLFFFIAQLLIHYLIRANYTDEPFPWKSINRSPPTFYVLIYLTVIFIFWWVYWFLADLNVTVAAVFVVILILGLCFPWIKGCLVHETPKMVHLSDLFEIEKKDKVQ